MIQKNYFQYKTIISVLVFVVSMHDTYSQVGYQKDSLQIKVYAQYTYINYRLKSINIAKIFCDYCSKSQTAKIKEEASRLAYSARNNRDYIQENGVKKLAMYIRVSKKDFAALKEKKLDN